MKMHSEMTGVLCVLVAGSTWGCIGLFTRYLSAAGMNVMSIALLRCIAATIILGMYLAITQRHIFHIKLRDLWMFIGAGFVSIATSNTLYFYTQTITTLSVAAVLLYTTPFFVIFISAIFFKEPVTRVKMLAVVLAFCGCLFVSGFFGGAIELVPRAVFTGLSAAFTYAFYGIFSNIALRYYKPMTVTFYSLAISAFGPALVILVTHAEVGPLTQSNIICILLFGLVSTAVPYVFYTKGLQYISPSKASIIAFSEPMMATIVGFIVLGEAITLHSVIGILLILSGIIVLNKKS